MTAMDAGSQSQAAQRFALTKRFDVVGLALPVAALIAILLYSYSLNSETFSYLGLDLVLSSAVPLVFATLSQAFVIALGDIDLGIGYLVGLGNVVVAVYLSKTLWLGVLVLIGLIAAYALQGFIICWRRAPSIPFTLGASFVWLGLGHVIAPTPSGKTPHWLNSILYAHTPLLPVSGWLIIAAALVAYVIFFRLRIGLLVRAAGANSGAYQANGASLLKVKAIGYGLAGLFGLLAAFVLTQQTGSGDVTASSDYTLLAVAGVILGGGSFRGGKVSAVGAVVGALVLSLVGSLLAQLNVSSNLQTGVEGLVLLAAIAGRRLLARLAI
jgi:ribose transport system permease protein